MEQQNSIKMIPVGRAKDLTGKTFNNLKVLYRTENKGKRVQWCCQCNCGNITVVDIGNLTSNHTKSCGCLKETKHPIYVGDIFGELTVIEFISNCSWKCKCSCGNIVELTTEELHKNRKICGFQHETINLLNQKFGRLLVIEKTDKRTPSRGIIWKCKCDCGNECEVSGYNLKNNITQSCGCYRKEQSKKATLIDLTGQTFGRWKVLKLATRKNNVNEAFWECECQCAAKTHRIVSGSSLRSKTSQSCGCMKSKGEEKIANLLIENNIPFEREKTFKTCILPSGRLARFDFYVNNTYLIEYDGIQHFKSTGWTTEENLTKNKKYDKIKEKWCEKNNIPLIRIPYTKYDKITIKDLLLKEK